jgi:hypothetical protein
MDLAEEIQRKREGHEDEKTCFKKAAEQKMFDESAKRAEKIRKDAEMKQAYQAVFNCIVNHYDAKAREEAGIPEKAAIMECASDA